MSAHTDRISYNFRCFLNLMQAVINETETPLIKKDVNWNLLYEIAIKHSLAGMLYYAIQKLPKSLRPQDDFVKYLRQMYREQIVADFNLTLETDRILSILSSQGVRCLPVKGIVTKADYPESHLRTMTDVDVLCDSQSGNIVEKCFIENGYVKESVGIKDISYRKDDILHFEMHHSLVTENSPAYSYFSKIWDRVNYKKDSFIASMSIEDTYIYMLEHLASHIESGGAGIRMYIDVYVFLKKHENALDRVYVDKILKDILLTDFEKVTVKICNNWFSGKEEADTASDIALFILNSSTFGRSGVSFLSDNLKNYKHSQSAVSNGFKRISKKLFPSIKWMKKRFKAVDKLPVLYPFFVPVHWIDRLFFKHNVNTANLGSYFTSADSEEAKELTSIFTSLGLNKRI